MLLCQLCHVPALRSAVRYVNRGYLQQLLERLPYDVNMHLHPNVPSCLHTALKYMGVAGDAPQALSIMALLGHFENPPI